MSNHLHVISESQLHNNHLNLLLFPKPFLQQNVNAREVRVNRSVYPVSSQFTKIQMSIITPDQSFWKTMISRGTEARTITKEYGNKNKYLNGRG